MLSDIIYSEHELEDHMQAVKTYVKENNLELGFELVSTSYGRSLAWYLLFTYLPDLVGLDSTSPTTLYNRYYHFKKFSLLCQAEHGPDAGLEQQAFQILESASSELDWNVIEEIEELFASLKTSQ